MAKEMSVCRICLNHCGKNFPKKLLIDKWCKMYEFCCGISVTANDTSRLLCRHCQQTLEQYTKFKTKCLKSDALLKSLTETESKKMIVSLKTEDAITNTEYTSADVITKFNKILEQQTKPESQIEDVDNKILPHEEIYEESEYNYVNVKKEDNIDTSVDDSTDFVSLNDEVVCQNDEIKNEIVKELEIKKTTRSQGKQISKHTTLCRSKEKVVSVLSSSFSACGLCDFESGIDAVKEHLKSHFDSKDLACKLCLFIGADLAEMVSHRYSHLSKGYKISSYMCHICDKIKLKLSRLEFHYRSAHFSIDGVSCTVCQKKFKSYPAYKTHKQAHQGQSYICDHCGKNFPVKSYIIEHLRYVMGKTNYFCDKCGKSFKKLYNFKMHTLAWHTVSEPIKCHHCSKLFKNKPCLNQHLRKYAGEKPFKCDVCSKAYANQNMLEKHKIWHTDIRPFRCEICGLAYKAKGQLTIHMRNHTGNFPYKCNDCDRGFASSGQLKVHRSVHTGVRKYKCSLCTKSFHGKFLLRNHCEKVHNVKENV